MPDHRSLDTACATEAAREGLNLRANDLLISYDMPWNPMRVERSAVRVAVQAPPPCPYTEKPASRHSVSSLGPSGSSSHRTAAPTFPSLVRLPLGQGHPPLRRGVSVVAGCVVGAQLQLVGRARLAQNGLHRWSFLDRQALLQSRAEQLQIALAMPRRPPRSAHAHVASSWRGRLAPAYSRCPRGRPMPPRGPAPIRMMAASAVHPCARRNPCAGPPCHRPCGRAARRLSAIRACREDARPSSAV